MWPFGVLFLIVISGERIFLKKVLENLNAFKNSGNIPDGQIFFKKAVLFSEFLAIYLIEPERFQNFWQYTWCEKFFEKRVNDFGFSAYVLWWQPQKCLKEGIYEKSHDFFKGSRKKSGHSGKKLDRVKKNHDFLQKRWDKNGMLGRETGQRWKISDFFKNGGTKPVQPGEKLGRGEKFRISSKMVVVNGARRERNWMRTQWR